MKKKNQSKVTAILEKICELNERFTITLTIPIRYILIALLLLMAISGKIGATIALWITAFVVIIFLIPDDF